MSRPTQTEPREPVDLRRLSRSSLWEAQRNYFVRRGIEAWRTGEVPHYVTSNPALAQAYARVILGFLRDTSPLRSPEPVHVVELGAGSGRFGFLLLGALSERLSMSSLRDLSFRYVMTDLVPSNVAFWREHPSLRPFVDAGVLDFAVFDAVRDAKLTLLESRVTLAPGEAGAPMVAIANYVFDGIEQDAFTFKGGEIEECLVSAESGGDATELVQLASSKLDYSRRAAGRAPYGEPALDRILAGYASTLDGSTVLFPVGALRCLDRLEALAGERLLVLTADRGTSELEELRYSGEPELLFHGSVSTAVNYHAIGEYVLGRGGTVLRPSHAPAHLEVLGLAFGPGALSETRLAFAEAVERGGPNDVFLLRRVLQAQCHELDLDQALAYLRLSHGDSRVLLALLPTLRSKLAAATPLQERDLAYAIRRATENHFDIGEPQDLLFELGLFHYELGRYEDALAAFERFEATCGGNARVRWNVGLCLFSLDREDDAVRAFREARGLDAGFRPVGALERDPRRGGASTPHPR